MARWENENVDNLNLPDPVDLKRTLYDKTGEIANKEEHAFAMQVESDSSCKYYIRYNRGELVDPHSIDFNLKTQLSTFKKVNEKSFNQYIKYLETKNRLYFTRSRRLSQEN